MRKMVGIAYRTLIEIGAVQKLLSTTIGGQLLNELSKLLFVDWFVENTNRCGCAIETLCLPRNNDTCDSAVLKVLHQIGSGPAVGKV